TLHGVTKAVEIPGQARLADGQIQVAGSLTFGLADFEIVAPNVGGFIVSIADEGALELDHLRQGLVPGPSGRDSHAWVRAGR
ncbi:MAG: hypothetical protein ACSLFN_16160, partial [Candidatus Limnocylindrales bacterium]